MSFYANIQGCIQYQHPKDKAAALAFLCEGGWVDVDQDASTYFWQDEIGAIDHMDGSLDDNEIIIPWSCYRNLAYHLNRLVAGSCHHNITYDSTDGTVLSGVIVNGREMSFSDEQLLIFVPADEDLQPYRDLFEMDVDEFEKKHGCWGEWATDLCELASSAAAKSLT